MEVNKEKIRHILQFFFDNGENVNQVAEIVNGVYGVHSVTANYVQFWFRRFRSGIFDVKDTPYIGRPVGENVDKITEVDRHVNSRSMSQELKIKHRTVLTHLRKYGQTLNLDFYCQQLDRLKLAIDQKRQVFANLRGDVFYQDSAYSHTSVVTRQKPWELGWEVLMHPPYSPGLAPSDYHLFLALQNFLSDKKLGSREDCENRLLKVFANEDQDF
ncbi:histone-lysine N-methyltransferase SETMAR [Trichonephila clavipes]|nr:histone-lysine N-methyltransferase SETMAR [Trichonephila clavipes]